MYQFKVEGMTCGGCARGITAAIHGADPKAKVNADVGAKTVNVESNRDEEELSSLIKVAGYGVESVTRL